MVVSSCATVSLAYNAQRRVAIIGCTRPFQTHNFSDLSVYNLLVWLVGYHVNEELFI